MKLIIYFFIIITLFLGCSKEPQVLYKSMPQTYLLESELQNLPNWESEDFRVALNSFIESCKTSKTEKIYSDLCIKAVDTQNPKEFLEREFVAYQISNKDFEDVGLLTGYYEPQLRGSWVKKEPYIYPIYKTPNDLIVVDLSSIYPKLKDYRLRGRVDGNRLVPYYTREETESESIDAEVICYTDSKVDLFFLEVQGSGRVTFEDGKTIFIGFDNQNGHKYRSIGKYLVSENEIALEDISLQSIKAWFVQNPHRIDEVLNYNKSVVYFKEREHSASGSLGVELTPNRSVAIDRRYISLGSMLYLSADIEEKNVSRVVQAQDTGGAIKGAVRADMFFGFTEEAMEIAGELKAPLKLWILLPKNITEESK
ncbi:MAG: murein transglycosylase A [Campylobacterota bacterium]|nr:murein transglycosylase A [Campylobacterota bacterium]